MNDRDKRGNVYMLTQKLQSSKLKDKKQAMKTIISAMTVGEDVSLLFSAIIKNMESENLELKKLIYLYVINYAKTHPDLVILAINSFRKDAMEANNPILRALAVRTMGCIRVSQITEYLVNPLRDALKDEDSYVRKTGVICVIKMYDSNPELIERLGFVQMLQKLLTDGNAMVVSNAVAALEQISQKKGVNLLKINDFIANKLLAAMNEATEWGKTYILDAMAGYIPSSALICEDVLERIASNLSHQNPGIVLSTIRIIIKYLDYLSSKQVIRNMCRRVTPVLVTLMTCDHEYQYVVLKNINVIIQKRPVILERQIKMFFCKYRDPHYIKLEKLEILLKLADEQNIDQILRELKEYVLEVDVDFVRKCINTLGRLAIKLESCVDKCVNTLFECLKKKASYMIQESVIVMRDIFRKYPKRYEGVLPEIFENLKIIIEPEARASLIWILGEYAQIIVGGGNILKEYLDNFEEQAPQVQLNLLTATIRFYFVNPEQGAPLCERMFKIIQKCENPDLRDRGYIYWRMIQKNAGLAKKLLMRQKPTINDMSYQFDSNLLDKLVDGISTLSAIYYKEPEQFVKILRDSKNQRWEEQEEENEDMEILDSTGKVMGSYQPQMKSNEYEDVIKQQGIDLLGDGPTEPQTAPQTAPVQQQVNNDTDLLGEDDLLGGGGDIATPVNQTPTNSHNNIIIPYFVCLKPEAPGRNGVTGVKIEGAVQKEGNDIYLHLKITNNASAPISGLQLKVDVNSYKLRATSINFPIASVPVGSTQTGKVQLDLKGQGSGKPPDCPFKIRIALNTNLDMFVFPVAVSFTVLFSNPPNISPTQFEELMKRPNQVQAQKNFDSKFDENTFKKKMEDNLALFVNQIPNKFGCSKYFFFLIKLDTQNWYIKTLDGMDIGVKSIVNNGKVMIAYQGPIPQIMPLVFQGVKFINDF